MYEKILIKTNKIINKTISEEKLNYMQDILIQLKIYVQITDILSYLLIISLLLFLILLFMSLILDLSNLIILLSLSPIIIFLMYLLYKKEKRLDLIEADLPDYLLQISSLLNIGMAIESAFDEVSKNMDGYLNDEFKRALIEIKMGKSFNDAFNDITHRCDSYNLKKVIQLIINTKESGGSLSEVLEMTSQDIRESLMLKKNRRASVMMSVMFLLVSSVIATPFSFGTIQIYAEFLESVGRTNSLLDVIPVASLGYILIHSLLVSLLIAIVMESNYKKAIKWVIIIIPSSLGVFYISKLLIKMILGI